MRSFQFPHVSIVFSIKKKGFGMIFTIVKRYPTSINEVANHYLTEGKNVKKLELIKVLVITFSTLYMYTFIIFFRHLILKSFSEQNHGL